MKDPYIAQQVKNKVFHYQEFLSANFLEQFRSVNSLNSACYTHCVILLLMQGQEETSFHTVPGSVFSSHLSSSSSDFVPLFPVAHKRPCGWNEGIPLLARFNVINPVFRASLCPGLSLLSFFHLAIPQYTHSHLSLSSQVGNWSPWAYWKSRPLGTNTEAPVCKAFCFNEKLKPPHLYLYKQSPAPYKLTHTHRHKCTCTNCSRSGSIITYALWSPAGI